MRNKLQETYNNMIYSEYIANDTTNDFFRNNLVGYSKWLRTVDDVEDFDGFAEKTKNQYQSLEKVISYFTNITNDDKNKSLNVLRCFHLLSINFLNKYGLDYQKTNKSKLKEIVELYSNKIMIKNSCNMVNTGMCIAVFLHKESNY